MKQLMLNDGRSMELKAYFMDTFATSVMTLYENGKPVDPPYENYTVLKYIKEETGGIWEVELRQTAADTDKRIADLEAEAEETREAISQANTDLQMAIAELTMVIATLAAPVTGTEGGETDV